MLRFRGILDMCMNIQKFLSDDVIKFYPLGNCWNAQVNRDY